MSEIIINFSAFGGQQLIPIAFELSTKLLFCMDTMKVHSLYNRRHDLARDELLCLNKLLMIQVENVFIIFV